MSILQAFSLVGCLIGPRTCSTNCSILQERWGCLGIGSIWKCTKMDENRLPILIWGCWYMILWFLSLSLFLSLFLWPCVYRYSICFLVPLCPDVTHPTPPKLIWPFIWLLQFLPSLPGVLDGRWAIGWGIFPMSPWPPCGMNPWSRTWPNGSGLPRTLVVLSDGSC